MSDGGKTTDINQNTTTTASSGTQWLVHGTLGLFLGTASFAITYSKWLESISWGYLGFLLFYTIFLLFLFTYFTKPASESSSTSLRPNGLTRFRSYLTFFPITQIISHGEAKESLRTNENQMSEAVGGNKLSIRINVQKELVIEAILDEYIAPWYTKISNNTIFLKQSREILQTVFSQLSEKIKQVSQICITLSCVLKSSLVLTTHSLS
jgi:hypothetical protein